MQTDSLFTALINAISNDVVERIKPLLTPASSPTTKTPQSVKFLTRQETANKLGVSLPTLNFWTKDGVIKGYRIGSRVRYKEDEVEASLISIKTK